jgi:hypothetical protein
LVYYGRYEEAVASAAFPLMPVFRGFAHFPACFLRVPLPEERFFSPALRLSLILISPSFFGFAGLTARLPLFPKLRF